MAWYHQFQYAEVKSPFYPTLKGKALPIVSYEITNEPKAILRVKLEIARNNFQWFNKSDISLYKSGHDLIVIPDRRHNVSVYNKILRSLNIKRFF